MDFIIENGVLKSCFATENETEVIVPNNVTRIDDYAFFNQDYTTIIIPNGVTTIGSYTFSYCHNLANIVIPNTVTSIGDGAFEFCTSLTNIVIPNSVKSIGIWAFLDCSNLRNVIISNNIIKINIGTFSGCKNLTNITIPNGVVHIGATAFQDCTNLQTTTKNYKAFHLVDNELVCRDYHFIVNEWSEEEEDICICKRGYHYCTNLFDIFNYYDGKLDEEIVLYECEVGNKVKRGNSLKSKYVTNKIKPIKRLYREDIIKILNSVESE